MVIKDTAKNGLRLLLPEGTRRHAFAWPKIRIVCLVLKSIYIRLNLSGRLNNVLKIQPENKQRMLLEWDEYVTCNISTNMATQITRMSLVSILYNRSNEIGYFVDALSQQSFEGTIELILVDDCSPDDSVAQLKKTMEAINSDRLELKLIRNARNLGNCHSRNIGTAQATGDVIVIIDADCVMNRDYMLYHCIAHAANDCHVVIGPHNLETNGLSPEQVIKEYADDLNKTNNLCELQDKDSLSSFVNCITRNFSIKKSFLPEVLFDPDFTYSRDPESGFGWEDVEMGYRLYKAGARVKYIPSAFTVHMSHAPSVDAPLKAQRSLRNFRRIFEKHPELMHVARQWSVGTYRDILKWGGAGITDTNPDKQFLDNHFKSITPYPFFIRPARKLKILTYRWHCPHQYELYKLPYQFILATGIGLGLTNEWEYEQRPFPANAEFQHIQDIDPSEYDLAILHFDENALDYQNTNGVIGAEWGQSFRWFCENVNLPKVAICHGTPQFHGQYTQKYIPVDQLVTIEESRKKLVDYVGDMLIICNSHQAEREWGFRNSKVIWQGFDPTEFPLGVYKEGILTLGASMKERPHYRGYFLYNEVFKEVAEEYLPQGHNVPKPTAYPNQRTNLYAWSKFRNYVDSIRAYSIYFNPTWRSPMPRARGEAMMCGLVPVSAHNHDVDMFIKNGINGYYSNDPAELRDYMLFLLKNPDACRKTGYEARMTAMDLFNHDRYLWSWQETIQCLLGASRA